MISIKEVQHIAKLARIGITKSEEEKFRKEISSILGYVEKLKKADFSETKSASHFLVKENVKRKDEVGTNKTGEKIKLLEMAPEIKDGYIKVKSILK